MLNKPLRRPLTLASIFALTWICSLAWPVSADWLRTQKGDLIETRGAWKVKGALVVFTSKGGTLSSLRLSEVDLDASAVATMEAKSRLVEGSRAEGSRARSGSVKDLGVKDLGVKDADQSSEAKARPTGEPVLVLTDKDIPRARSVGESDSEGDEPSAPGADEGPDAGASSLVTVSSWREVASAEVGGVEIRGTVKNQARQLVTNLRVVVRLEDADGELLGVSNGFLGALSLVPGATTQFRAIFPEVSTVSPVPKFEVLSDPIDIQSADGPQPEGQES